MGSCYLRIRESLTLPGTFKRANTSGMGPPPFFFGFDDIVGPERSIAWHGFMKSAVQTTPC